MPWLQTLLHLYQQLNRGVNKIWDEIQTGVTSWKVKQYWATSRHGRVPQTNFRPIAQIGYFKDAESYSDGNPDFPDERAGSNDSDKDDFIEGDGWDNFFRLRLKYLLPIGHGKDTIINT